jgi:serine/threonine protein kinase|tara:strand:- start:6216 stop:9173 length:2958 start_codon:yes stop_codon:yes gene_type:complete
VAPSELSLTFLLKEAQSLPLVDRKKLFLNKFPNAEDKYEIIEEIIKACGSTSPLDIVKLAVTNAVDEVDAKAFVGLTFDNWLTTDVIAITNKNIILKAQPADNSYDQVVAIKIVSPIFSSLSNNTYIKKQAHLMEVLKHPNLIELKGAGTVRYVDYVAMEFLSGQNIVEHCQGQAITLKQVLTLFSQICSCVDNMHSYSVIHSDLKPDNILMSGQNIVKILDFDLANVQDKDVNSDYDYDNVYGRTKEYASPEQLVTGIATKQSDVFALGKILYEMLSGMQFDLHQTTSCKEGVFKKHGKSKLVIEVISIVIKACKVVPQDRYTSVKALMDDVNRVFSSSVVKAHKTRYLFFYRVYKKARNNLKLSLAILVMCFAIFFGFFGVFIEQGFSDNSIKTLTSVVDPRRIDSKNAFDTLAKSVYEQTWIFKNSQFKQLIDFGDAYYGSGKIEQSIKFFSKAKTLFTDKYSTEYIMASSKLALAKYTLGHLQEALVDLEEYRTVIFNGEPLVNPALIDMLFTIIEVNSQARSLNILGELEFSVNDTLKLINTDGFEDENKKNEVKANLLFFKSINIYYNLENGDLASSSVLHSESEYQSITKPALVKAKDHLELALKILNKNEITSHRKPLIYLWLGRLHSELRNKDLAKGYADSGVTLTKMFFGLEHPRVIDALLKQYATLRNIEPLEAFNVIKNAATIAKNYQRNQYTIFVYPVLIEVALGLGDLAYARTVFQNAIRDAKYLEAENNLSFIDLDAITTMIALYNEFLFQHSLDQDVLPYLSEQVRYELLIKQSTGKALNTFDLLGGFYERLQSEANHEEISKNLYTFFQYKMDLNNLSTLPEDLRFVGMFLVDLCSKLEGCDSSKMMAATTPYELWTAEEDKSSFDKLIFNLRKANNYVLIGKFVEANKAIEEVRNIFDYITSFNATNVYIALFNEIKIKYHIERGEFKEAKQLIDKAFYISSLHFPKSARIYKSLENIKTLLENKDV